MGRPRSSMGGYGDGIGSHVQTRLAIVGSPRRISRPDDVSVLSSSLGGFSLGRVSHSDPVRFSNYLYPPGISSTLKVSQLLADDARAAAKPEPEPHVWQEPRPKSSPHTSGFSRNFCAVKVHSRDELLSDTFEPTIRPEVVKTMRMRAPVEFYRVVRPGPKRSVAQSMQKMGVYPEDKNFYKFSGNSWNI